jgi:hypothetical protein
MLTAFRIFITDNRYFDKKLVATGSEIYHGNVPAGAKEHH